MPEIVRAALVQSRWTGDKDSMIKASVELAREAAAQGAQVLCFQELFYGPYFCQVRTPECFARPSPSPAARPPRRCRACARARHGARGAGLRGGAAGIYYNTAFVVDADGSYLGKYRKTHIPQVQGFWEKFFFRPGISATRCSRRAVRPIGVYICYDRHFPEGWRALALAGAESFSTLRRPPQPVGVPVAAGTAGGGRRQRLLHRRDQPCRRGAAGRRRLLRELLFRQPAGPVGGEAAPDNDSAVVVRTWTWTSCRGTPDLGLLPRPQPGRLRLARHPLKQKPLGPRAKELVNQQPVGQDPIAQRPATNSPEARSRSPRSQ